MKVSLIGGTGFVGTYLIDALLAAGHIPRLLVRTNTETYPAGCETIQGDISSLSALKACVTGADTVIYLVGILREFPSQGISFEESQYQGVLRTLTAAQQQGVKQFILMSANGVRIGGIKYQDTKARAEEAVKAAGMNWTVFRPSVIFGDPRGKMEFGTQLKQELIKPPIPAPLFFAGWQLGQAGEFNMAPVHIRDVATAFVGAIGNTAAYGKTFTLCGPEAVSWKTIIQTLAQASGKTSKFALPAPASLIKIVAGLLDGQAWFPITRDQITMLLEGNTCTDQTAWQLFNIQPKPFSLEALRYLAEGEPSL